MRRGTAEFSITLAIGQADIFPELPAVVSGFKPIIDDTDWVVTQVTHSLSDQGLTTQLSLEIYVDQIDPEMIDEVEKTTS